MKILDEDNDKKVDNATIFITAQEAKQIYSYLGTLIEKPANQHFHLSSEDYQEELTICIYDEKDLSGLHERAKKLIEEDY